MQANTIKRWLKSNKITYGVVAEAIEYHPGSVRNALNQPDGQVSPEFFGRFIQAFPHAAPTLLNGDCLETSHAQ